jgi:hypothetical protein
VHRGCTSLGDVQCDGCHCIILYPERYLVIDEKDGIEVDKGETYHYCVDCCFKKGYARYTEEKGQQVLTFFPEKP